MLPRPRYWTSAPRFLAATGAYLAVLCLGLSLVTAETSFPEDQLFTPVDMTSQQVATAGVDDWALGGVPYQDFTVIPPPRTFPNCRVPLLSWRLGPCEDCGPCGTLELPAHAIRKAGWYVSSDIAMLRRDPRLKQNFAQRGVLGLGPIALGTSDWDIPLDAGGQFTLGRRFTERLSFEATYLGSYEWSDTAAVRNDDPNTLGPGGGGIGLLSSPFTNFGFLPVQGLDFNNFVRASTTNNLESLELMFRYRPDMPYGPFDVSFLYGLRYMSISERLSYHSESDFPGPGGSVNDYNVAADNDLLGAQLGITSHILVSPRFWLDWDLKGGIYNNHARQRTVYQNIDSAGALTSFANEGDRDDTAYSCDVRLIGNYQLLERLSLRFGYQATIVASAATGVSNFETDLDIVRLGPGQIDTTDTLIYHGPVLGLTWVR